MKSVNSATVSSLTFRILKGKCIVLNVSECGRLYFRLARLFQLSI